MTKIEQLAEIIRNSDNIVFFGGAGVSTENLESLTLEVLMDYLMKNLI